MSKKIQLAELAWCRRMHLAIGGKKIFDTWLGPLPVLLAAEAADDRLTAVWADILWAQYVSSHGSSSSGEGSLLRGEKYPPHFVQRWKGRLEKKLHLSDKATEPPESPQRLWSCGAPQSGQRPERPTGGFGVTEGNLYSIIQDRKLTLVVAASPYVGYRVVDEELGYATSWPDWFGICSQRRVSLGQ